MNILKQVWLVTATKINYKYVSITNLGLVIALNFYGDGILHSCMFNKTFYKFLMNFVAVVAAVLFFILVVGLGIGG